MQKSFNIKGRQISCEIVRSQRRTVAIQIHPDRRIELKVPLLYNINEVEPFLLKHYRWIFKRLDAPVAPKTEPKRFVDGELHYFLGKQYPMKIIVSPENTVVFQDDTIMVYAKNDLPDLIEVLLEKWYFTQARAVFQKISIPLTKQMAKYNVAPKSFTIKKMKTRWGSCSSKGSVNLNLDLIKLPEGCIKAVILHELCHLVHMNHSKEFYALMTAEMPDWKVWDKQLKFL
ncbi:MAG: M48 family metallopeptidase [Bacteroidales bacterium]|nr:M48 family metallopeptidase [Bacteroidales bacterium]